MNKKIQNVILLAILSIILTGGGKSLVVYNGLDTIGYIIMAIGIALSVGTVFYMLFKK